MKESQCLARIREISQYWVNHFQPCIDDDNNYYRGYGRIDGKDAAMIGEEFQEVLQLAEIIASNQAKLYDYATELAEEWVPENWRGKEGWRIGRVQEKHGVRHLFED